MIPSYCRARTLVPAVIAVVLASPVGCGGGSSDGTAPFAGRWSGTVDQALRGEDLHVTANMRPLAGASDIYAGDISTDASRCFTSAMLTATVSNGSLMLIASGNGSATQDCVIEITGDGGTPTVTGLFSMWSTLPDDCKVDPTPFTFVQQ